MPSSEPPKNLADALRDRYVLERELGRGGMATVYAAHDVRHDRHVALKVLHPELTATLGPERFQREIRFTAQLQHPHILPVFDSGELVVARDSPTATPATLLYYVMPYVEGESLRQRLTRDGELPVAEAVRLLEEIVEALAYAHDHGVVHRDIKPDNIMLSGRHALLADLGVAKAVSTAAPASEGLTATGIALGTPRYMAPEQVAADPHVDHRADIYAVGVMAYEMLSGAPPFPGTSAQAVFAAQVSQQPTPLEVLRPGLPPLLAQAIAKCLAPRPADRWQSAVELLDQLERSRPTGESTAPTRLGTQAPPPRPRRAMAVGIGLGVAAALAVAFLTARHPAPEIRFGARSPLTVEPGLEIDPAVSPDGQFVAYAAGPLTESRIYVRQADGGRPIPLAADLPGAQRLPYWSPDGKRILFRSGRGIEVVPALGGTPRVVVPLAGGDVLLPGPWSPDGRQVVFARSDSLYLVPVAGGTPTLLAHGGDMHSFAWSPDGRWIAAVHGNRQSVDPDVRWFFGNLGQSAVWLVPSHPGGDPVQLTDDHSFHASPVWLPHGLGILFLSSAEGGLDIYRLPLRDGAPAGNPERLTTGLNAHAMSMDAAGHRLAYAQFEERDNIWSLPIPTRPPVGIAGATPVTTGNQIIEAFDFSPDGRWLAFDSDRSGVSQIYRVPRSGGEPEQLTTDSSAKFWPAWSPDGREISYHAFLEGRRKLFVMAADGSSRVPLARGNDEDARTAAWKHDGRGLYYLGAFDSPEAKIKLLPRDASGRWGSPVTIMRVDALPMVESPDGRRLAFATDKALVITTPSGDSARTLLPVGYRSRDVRPTYVSWSADSRTLYYLALDSLDRASIWGIDPVSVQRSLLVRFDDPAREWHRYGFLAFGDRFYFTLGDLQSDLWTTEVDLGR